MRIYMNYLDGAASTRMLAELQGDSNHLRDAEKMEAAANESDTEMELQMVCENCGERVKPASSGNSDLLAGLKELRRMTNCKTGGQAENEYNIGYQEAMAKMRIAINNLVANAS